MRKRTLLLVPVLVLTSAVAALAYWTVTGAGSAAAAVGTLTAPGKPSGTGINGMVTLAWTAAESAGSVRYHVERRPDGGSTWASVCSSSDAAPIAAATCDDPAGEGLFVYRVTARVGSSWHTTSPESDPVRGGIDSPPHVTTIVRAGASPSNAASVQWTVTFSEDVTGVDATDFHLGVTGLAGAPAITAVTPGPSSTFTVTASTGSGDGTLALDLLDDDSITDSAAQPLDGGLAGPAYTLDRTPPVNALSLAVDSGRAFLAGDTVYYRNDSAGSLRIVNGATGAASTAFPAVASAGWSHAAETATTAPYTSGPYTWTAGATFTGPHTITSQDAVGNQTATTLGFAVDNAAPTGAALTVNGSAATSFNRTGSFSIDTRTDYADAGAGIASSTLTREEATLANSTCGAFGSAITITGSPVQNASAGIGSAKCYRYTLTGTDNLGNSASLATTVKVDTVEPVTSDNTATLGGAWRTSNATVTLTPSDAGGSNVAATYYTTDGTTPTTSSASGTSISLTTSGAYTIKYFSVDNAGNAEPVKTASTQIRIDKTAPANALALSSPVGAYLNAGTLYFKSNGAGSFTLVNTVADAHSGAASATFPAVAATNWTHAAATVTTPAGGPFASNYAWTSGAATPAATSLSSADVAGNASTATALTFVPDITAPTGGALTVNGTAAIAGGSTSTSTASTFPIDVRTNYGDAGSGLAGSVLTVQSATLTGSTCGAPGSGGPYASPTTISGTTNPAITKGFCYVYTLTGTDNVGNSASVSTTVKSVIVYTFAVSNPGAQTSSTAFGGLTLQLLADGVNATAVNGVAYTGAKTIAFSGPGTVPGGTAPSYPSTVTFTSGAATLPAGAITLTKAETTTLTATDAAAAIAGTSGSFTVSPGVAANLAWTRVTPTLSPGCLWTCTLPGMNNATMTATVAVTDAAGNAVSNVGTGHTVSVSRTGDTPAGSGFQPGNTGGPIPLSIGATGAAETPSFSYRAPNGSWSSVTLKAQTSAGTSYALATLILTK